MKYKQNKLLLILLFLSITPQYIKAGPLITFFFKPFPVEQDKKLVKKITNNLSNPKKIAKNNFYHLLRQNLVDGIFCTYAGYMATSDFNGQVIFPRRHQAPELYLIITPKLIPVLMAGLTIHHWELEEGTPAKIFHVARRIDEKTETEYFEINEQSLPKDHLINIKSIVIFAKPKNIYVPEGKIITKESPHLILPDIFVKKGIKKLEHALYILNLRGLFGPIYQVIETEPTRYRSLITI